MFTSPAFALDSVCPNSKISLYKDYTNKISSYWTGVKVSGYNEINRSFGLSKSPSWKKRSKASNKRFYLKIYYGESPSMYRSCSKFAKGFMGLGGKK